MRTILAEYNPRRNSIDVGVSKNKGKYISFHYLMGWKAHKNRTAGASPHLSQTIYIL